MDLNPIASGARKSTKTLQEYDFDLGSCREGEAVESFDTLISRYESFQGLLTRLREYYQAITDGNRSFVLQDTEKVTWCRMMDDSMQNYTGQAGPTAIRKDSNQDAPTTKWSRVISGIQAGLFQPCQANDPNDFYRGQLRGYEYKITEAQWNKLVKFIGTPLPSQSDWRDERRARQEKKAEFKGIEDLLVERAIDEKDAFIEEFELKKNGLAPLPAIWNPSTTTPSEEPCHEDSAYEQSPEVQHSILSVDDRHSHTTISPKDPIETSTRSHPKQRTEAEKAEAYSFLKDLQSWELAWKDIRIQYGEKFHISRTEGALSRGAISKPVVRKVLAPSTESYDDMNLHPSDACPETLADDAVNVPFANGLPLVKSESRVSV
ncbi:hypothetical protein N7486_006159 [Penicillium sp. IBT 16267x]|nr:hypothetical protein N7486_006159 [Penicillium sp. IBT 16267x]